MPDFYPTAMTDEAFVRGPARLMYAAMSMVFPSQISQVVNITTYAAISGWNDIGATKGGAQIIFNNAEETFDIDQILTDIATLPTDVTLAVQTQIGQATLDWLDFAWEGDVVATAGTADGGPQKSLGIGPFDVYTQYRLAVGFRRATTGKMRFAVFYKAQRSPQESTLTYNKTGEQQSIAVRWTILPDTSVSSPRSRFGTFFDQI